MAEVGGSTPSAPSRLVKVDSMSALCAALSLAQPGAILPKQAVRQRYAQEAGPASPKAAKTPFYGLTPNQGGSRLRITRASASPSNGLGR
jgi:hypothetical protein